MTNLLSVMIYNHFNSIGCINLARPERFELPTDRFEADYSIQLSYERLIFIIHTFDDAQEPLRPAQNDHDGNNRSDRYRRYIEDE